MRKLMSIAFFVLLAGQTFAQENCHKKTSLELQSQGVTITAEMDKNIALNCLEQDCYKIKAEYLMNVEEVIITSQRAEAIKKSCDLR